MIIDLITFSQTNKFRENRRQQQFTGVFFFRSAFLLLLFFKNIQTEHSEFIWVWQQRKYVWKEMETTVGFISVFKQNKRECRDELDL